MLDDSIFQLLFDSLQFFFCEVVTKNITDKSKSIISRLLFLLLSLLIAALLISIVIFVIYLFIFIDNTVNIFLALIIIVLALALFFGVIFAITKMSDRLNYFDSFKEEMDFSKNDNYSKHIVYLTLKQTDKDCFVMSYFHSNGDICPAVYKKRNGKIGLINFYAEKTCYKSIYTDEIDSDESKNIRVCRIRNKATQNQMIVFASEINGLEFIINGNNIPETDCKNRFGKFKIYALLENADTANCNTVSINGINYPLIESGYSTSFISRTEIIQ